MSLEVLSGALFRFVVFDRKINAFFRDATERDSCQVMVGNGAGIPLNSKSKSISR